MSATDPLLDQALATAREAAAAAAAVIARYYRGDFAVETKPDASPVTIADREAERAIRGVIETRFPAHGFHGEESGTSRGDADWLWLVDPIDGTKSFVRGTPFFSTQIALMHRGELLLGVSGAPHYGEVAWAVRGGGAFLNDAPLRVAATDRVERASLSLGNLQSMAADERWLRLAGLVRRAHRTRGYGDFLHYHLLAAGGIDAVIESDLNILDIAALSVIVREAGGVVSDLEGRPIGLHTTSMLAATPALHPVLLAAITDEPADRFTGPAAAGA